MPESRSAAEKRAKELGHPKGDVTCIKKKCFIAPFKETPKQKRAYAGCRAQGGKKSTCAAVSRNIGKKK